MSAPDLEALTVRDPTWYNRALAALEAERIAEPQLEERRRKEAARRQAEEAERRRAWAAEERRLLARLTAEDAVAPEPARGLDGQLYWPAAAE